MLRSHAPPAPRPARPARRTADMSAPKMTLAKAKEIHAERAAAAAAAAAASRSA